MKAKYALEISVDMKRTTRRYIPVNITVPAKYVTEDATIILSHGTVTVNGGWIDDSIYCTL
jgi:hypothetical protein